MPIADLTHEIHSDISLYPGTPLPEFRSIFMHSKSGFHESRILMTTHVGTHVDAPFHVDINGKYLDDFPLDHFMGSAQCVNLNGRYKITVSDLEPYTDQFADVDFVMLNTGWHKFWCQEQYMTAYPELDQTACEWLCQFQLKGLGIDFPSVDTLESTELPNHKILLNKQILIFENLTNLHSLPPYKFDFCGLPLKFKNMDGSQIRAVATW